MSYVYLASPYTHKNEAVMLDRYHDVLSWLAVYMKCPGLKTCVYSPILHYHPVAVRYKLPRTWDFWWHYNKAMLENADELWILPLDGWEESKGIAAEREYAELVGMTITLQTL